MFNPNVDGEIRFNNTAYGRNFICKISSIFMYQLLFALAFVNMAIFHDPTKLYVKSYPGFSTVMSIITLGILIMLACSEHLRRKSPVNFIFLFMVSLAFSFLLATSVSHYYPEQVFKALSVATFLCLALTMFALHTKIDFTIMGGFLMIAVIVLLVASIVTLFFPEMIMSHIVAFVWAVIYSLYLIYDIQLLVNGNHEFFISTEEYKYGVLAIYVSLMSLLMNILNMIVLDD